MERQVEIRECHMNREAQRFNRFLMFEYNKKSCVRKEDIYYERESEIDTHKHGNTHKVIFPENTKKKEIKSDDREEFEDGERITEFKNREKIHKPLRDSVLYTPLDIGRIESSLLSLGDKRHESSFCNRSYENIEDETDNEYSNNLPKVGSMDPLYDESEELVLQFEYIDVREGDLVEDNTTEPDSREKRGEEIEFLQKRGTHDEFPSRTYDRFPKHMLFRNPVMLMMDIRRRNLVRFGRILRDFHKVRKRGNSKRL